MSGNFNLNFITTAVRGSYDLQGNRIQFGNRVTGNYKDKMGIEPGMTEEQADKEAKKILGKLREDYKRITDGIILEGELGIVEGKMPTPKTFKGEGIIDTFTELVLVDQYMTLLKMEEKQFAMLGKLMTGIPIYDEFLSKVPGCGPQMSAVLLSEIDIEKAEYPSSLCQLAGLGVVTVGVYKNKHNEDVTVPLLNVYMDINGVQTKSQNPVLELQDDGSYLAEGKYPATITTVGMSRKSHCLIQKEYLNAEKKVCVRDSIVFSPFLKTKLIGVLAGSFLKLNKTLVDGELMSTKDRLDLAKSLGFVLVKVDKPKKTAKKAKVVDLVDEEDVVLKEETEIKQVNTFLRNNGYSVEVVYGKYGAYYYEYKNRLKNMPQHKEKSDGHQHAMALRFMIKRFLVDYYVAARTLAGLPVSTEYSEGKLGMVHGKAGGGKEDLSA